MEDKIFSATEENFEELALEVFHFQFKYNPVYQSWVNTLGVKIEKVKSIEQVPFLPISFFKSHRIATTSFEPQLIFESSGTTGSINSHHYVKSRRMYEESFMRGFELFYNSPEDYVILALLPSYLERKNSSLIVMVDSLIKKTMHGESGFYLSDHDELEKMLVELAQRAQPVLLIGVTFALLDFATNRKLSLPQTIIMETGGMKGRRKELTREEIHSILKKSFDVKGIHSEYGMTELLSQAYAKTDGIFQTPPWMKILVRDEEDPLSIKPHLHSEPVRGVINVIDLANLYSCSFIATDDLGSVSQHGFTISGRLDKSDLRGCSLLSL